MDDLEPITPPDLPFGLDDKIFYNNNHGNPVGKPYSYNDFLQELENISGVNPELLGGV